MPIRIKFVFDEHRYSAIVSRLRKVKTPGTLAKIDLKPFEKKALLFLQRIFPVSKSSTNQKEFGMHLVEGWRVNRIMLATTLGFQIDHLLQGKRHASKILDALDIGTNAWNYVASRTLRFIDRRRGYKRSGKSPWVSIRAGDSIHHHAHAGTFYRQRTFNYINEILLPQIRDKVSGIVAKEVNG